MLKSIFSICAIVLLSLLLFVLVLPKQAKEVAQKVLGQSVTLPSSTVLSSPVSTIARLLSPSAKDSATSLNDNDSALSVDDIINATNAERLKAGLLPLKTNDKLDQSAKIKVDDMITNQYFEHTSPSGKTVVDLANEVGYDYVVLGENLAVGDFTNVQDLLTAWMNSPGHRANILSTSYQDIGVYVAQGTYQGQTVWFAVQHFGTQRAVCPAIDTSLKSEIDTLNTSIQNQEIVITTLRSQIEDPNHVQGQPYTDMITQFNALVTQYNADLTTSQNEITDYNQQVVTFNNCLAQYQTPLPADKTKE